MTPGEREARALFKQLGLRLVCCVHDGRNHLKITALTPGGNEFKTTCSNTPGEHRGLMNQRAYLKRKIKELDGATHGPDQSPNAALVLQHQQVQGVPSGLRLSVHPEDVRSTNRRHDAGHSTAQAGRGLHGQR